MPYWSSSRVGVAVDGPPATKSRSARKGITMEDLKKQTALRLAHEHGRTGEKPLAEPAPVRPRYSPRGKGSHPHGGASSNSFHQNRCGGPTTDRHSNSHVTRSPPQQTRSFPSPADHRQPPTNVAQPQQQRSFHSSTSGEHHGGRPAPPSHSLSASRSVDSAAEKGSNSKLPHGLTVHELKEMTKARLAAERGVVPAVPTTVQVSADPNVYQHPQARSPFPGEMAGDAWETASVSTAASEYQGSLNGTASFNGDDAIPFARSSSYPNTNNNSNNNNNNNSGMNSKDWSDIYQTPLATDSYAPNRRRAVTLSPRPGLVHLHEHRPVLPPPSMPMDMNSGGGGPLGRPQQSFPQQPSDFYSQRYADVGSNRARTSSAVSLPSISHTAEEFGGAPAPIRFSSQFDSVREDAAVTGLSDVFRGSGDCSSPAVDDFGGNGTATTSTASASTTLQGFNSTPTSSSMGLGSSGSTSFGGSRIRAATTTSSSDFLSMGSTSSSTDAMLEHQQQQDLRHRAATWSEPTLDMFCGQDLSEDLASILKLSGAEQKDDLP